MTSSDAARSSRCVDAETRANDDHHQSLKLWLRLLACVNTVESRIRQKLQARFEITLPRFDLMAQLERSPEGLKMGELSRRMMVTGGNVTGITDMLEREGLVQRVTDAVDRRAFRVRLTPEGRKVFRRMAAEHEQWIRDLFAGLGVKDKNQLAALLGLLKSSLNGQTGAQNEEEGPA